ncbi:MAG: diguanylate cyclase [Rhodospirillales bacterium]|nr:diguanylate cyclase [Rhodospirillales bacterium]
MTLFTFNRISHKILGVVGLVMATGLVGLVAFYVHEEEENLLAQNQRVLINVTESVVQSLNAVMIAGYADIGAMLSERLKSVPDVIEFRILRTDGTEAFQDNRTVKAVNERLGDDRFPLHKTDALVRVMPGLHPRLVEVQKTGQPVTYIDTQFGGERIFTILAPILHQDTCRRCHADETKLRGVLKLTTSLKAVDTDIASTWQHSLLILGLTFLAVMAISGLLLRRAVIVPIQAMTQAMHRASGGDLSQTVPEVSRDELGQMAKSFNAMIGQILQMYDGLQQERNKLTTILLGAQEGMVATDRDGQVVLVNPAAVELLGKTHERIVADGFMALFDDPDWMLLQLGRPPEGDQAPIQTLAYKDRILSVHVGQIAGSEGQIIGSAALMRDVTQETRLREDLRRQSDTDALTGLFNRRYFDGKLATEHALALRYDHPLSVFLFDVDHFKKFNDTHGHDQGDRVLQHVATAFRQTVRPMDVACRYGGEEFIAILPNTGDEAAAAVAESVRRAVESMVVDGLSVTISIGVATFKKGSGEEPDALVKRADTALYAAKKAGRNCVRQAEPVAS